MEIREIREIREINQHGSPAAAIPLNSIRPITPQRIAALRPRFQNRPEDHEIAASLAMNVLGWGVGLDGTYQDLEGNPTGYAPSASLAARTGRAAAWRPLMIEKHMHRVEESINAAGRLADYCMVLAALARIDIRGDRWTRLKSATLVQRAYAAYLLVLGGGNE